MSTVQARRTLVKSPPELWAELSDAEILGRRLQPFGEIRITRLEPETSLAWEGERVRGTVEIEASGWGTRVTLTAEPSEDPAASSTPSAEASEPPPASSAPVPEAGESPPASHTPVPDARDRPRASRTPVPDARDRPPASHTPVPDIRNRPPASSGSVAEAGELTSAPVVEPSQGPPATAAPDRAEQQASPRPDELPQTTAALGQGYDTSGPIDPRPGPLPIDPGRLVSRLFGIRWRSRGSAPRAETPAPEAPPLEPAPVPLPDTPEHPEPEPEVPPEPEPEVPPEPDPEVPPQPEPDVSPQPELPLEPAADRSREWGCPAPAALDEVLSGVLDDLGAAHHRPFSRG